MNVLLMGNSHTYYNDMSVQLVFPAMAVGWSVVVDSHVDGGCQAG